jgi:hypothetical protein
MYRPVVNSYKFELGIIDSTPISVILALIIRYLR